MQPNRGPKDEVGDLLDNLPEDATYEDIQYAIYVRQAIENGLAAVDRAIASPLART